MQLASWEAPGEQPPAGSSATGCSVPQQLQLAALDPSAPASGVSLAAAAGQLAAVVAAAGNSTQMQQRMQLQLQLPAEQLLGALAGNLGGSAQGKHAALRTWHAPDETPGALGVSSPQALPALLQLLSTAAFAEEQRQPLLLAAAQAAAATGNSLLAQRLLARAEAALPADSSSVGSTGSELVRRLLSLQADLAEAGSTQAWQLLQAAHSSSAAAAGAVVPAAAKLLSQQLQQADWQAVVPPADLAGLIQSCQLPGVSPEGTTAVAALEQYLLVGQHERQAAHAAEEAALTAAVSAAPGSASRWWQSADWLAAWKQQQPAGSELASAAAALAFTASCRALSLAGGSSGSTGSGYAALPTLFSILRQLTKPGSTSSASLPADAAAQLAAVPAAVWLPLVPQLLSHLAASPSSTRSEQLVLGLLLHIGAAAPCQVLLPAMVAADASGAAGAAGQPPAAAPLQQLLDALRQQQPQLAQQLSEFTGEAARLAVLPEEHWHTVLQEAAATAARRLQQRRQQQQREAVAGAAGEADGVTHFAALAPVLLCLQQQVEAVEGAAPETPHERRFHQQQLPKLRQLLQQLAEHAAATVGEPGGQQQPQAVTLLRAAAAEMGATLRQRQLALADVAPALGSLAGHIPVPGAVPGSDAAPELAGVAAEVAVLATKTRPKRLRFVGTDGQEHAFLLKVRLAGLHACVRQFGPLWHMGTVVSTWKW